MRNASYKSNNFLNDSISNESKIIYSAIHSVQETFQILLEVCYPFFDKSTITLLPFGPKPHVLACILMANNFGAISCLYASRNNVACSVIPTGELVITSVELRRPIESNPNVSQ